MNNDAIKPRPTVAGAETYTGANPLAVIDIGTTSVRMDIAQVGADGIIRPLELVRQPVSLGKDTFTNGRIEAGTIEECVRALKTFCRLLGEYRMSLDTQVRAVATSAVREADNRESFLDRITIATGLKVEAIDEAEINRFTYLSLRSVLGQEPSLHGADTLIVEVGGGNTELLALREDRVRFSQGFRLGSLRMRQLLEDYRAPATRLRQLLESQIGSTIDQIRQAATEPGVPVNVISMGGDIRFAVSLLEPSWDKRRLASLSVPALAELTEEVLSHSVDELVQLHHLTYPEAETLGPALLVNVRLAQAFRRSRILVSAITMRDGILAEMASRHMPWGAEFTQQIMHSAMAIAERYRADLAHARHVADLSRRIFDVMIGEHHLSPRHAVILEVSALLHDVGFFVSNRSHHKHSMYLIANSDLFGFGTRDIQLTALVARYHRKALPRQTHAEYVGLDRESRIAMAKLAAILRVADALDRSHNQRIDSLELTVQDSRLTITARNVTDLTLEQLALRQKGDMFEQVYGMSVVLRKGKP